MCFSSTTSGSFFFGGEGGDRRIICTAWVLRWSGVWVCSLVASYFVICQVCGGTLRFVLRELYRIDYFSLGFDDHCLDSSKKPVTNASCLTVCSAAHRDLALSY